MKPNDLEARPFTSPAFLKYKEALRVAQQNPCQVTRARLYREARLEYLPESPEMRAYHNERNK